MVERVAVIFYDKTTRRMHQATVRSATGLMANEQTLRIQCADVAWDNKFSHWAQPDPNDPTAWLVFECTGRSSRVFCGRYSTREAAEMRLLHTDG